MNRREFLLFGTEGGNQVAELSCEKLFMHYQDLTAGFQQSAVAAGNADDADWWADEPPLAITRADPEQFFLSILTELGDVEKLTVRDLEWLGQRSDFRSRVEALLAAFEERGGDIRYAQSTTGDDANAAASTQQSNQ